MIEEIRKQLDATRLKLYVLDLILGVTTKPPAKHTHRRLRLLFEIDLAISVAEYTQAYRANRAAPKPRGSATGVWCLPDA